MSYEVTIRLTDREYAMLAAEAAKSGKQPEMLLHEMIQRLRTVPQEQRPLTDDELAERLYRDGKILNLPERKVLTPEERARRERLAQIFAGGKPASEMVSEDRGTVLVSTYFLDTSAVVKRYFLEQGHDWIVDICDPAQEHRLYISQAALVEVVATICRKAREQSIADEERDSLINTFRQDCQSAYIVWPVTTAIYTAAGNLCRSHKLRAYDAVQLTCALALYNETVDSETPMPVFICADKGLIETAVAEKLNIENPNNY